MDEIIKAIIVASAVKLLDDYYRLNLPEWVPEPGPVRSARHLMFALAFDAMAKEVNSRAN